MARFQRQEASEDRLADTLGAATEQLRAALEREAVEIINKAREEAASIEEEARLRAEEIEREARVRADEAREEQSARVAALVRDVEALEERMLDAVRDLRNRLQSEAADAEPPPSEPDEPAPAPDVNGAVAAEEEAPPPAAAATEHAMPLSGPVPMSVATEVGAATEPNPVLDDMMRAQITTFAENGTSRADAERFLSRFKLGESYIGMLDEIYSQHAQERTPEDGPGRRRRFRRRAT